MKKNIVFSVLTVGIAMFSFSVNAQETASAAPARKEIAGAKQGLKEARTDSAADFQKFKKDAEIKLKANQIKIAELKAKKPMDTKEIRQKYDKKVLVLEQKNNQLKNRINKSDSTKTTMWNAFKRYFNRDMEELNEAFKDLGANNAK